MKDLLISALKLSGQSLLQSFNKPLEIRVKEINSSIVTDADIKSENLILKIINESYPKHNIISEEFGFINNNSEYTWVVDPLDGTSNFAVSLPWFGVLISLFKQNIPVMAGAYLPIGDQLFFAEKDKGAFKNGQSLIIPDNKELKNSLIAFSVDYTGDEVVFNRGITIYKHIVKRSRNIRCTNSLVDFLYVFEGKFGAVINLYTRIWDISGLGLIISEAGGVMLDVEGREIDYIISDEILERNFPVIAGSRKFLESLNITSS